MLRLKCSRGTAKSRRNRGSPFSSCHRRRFCMPGHIRNSATMNSLPVDHPPSNSPDSVRSPVVNDLRNPLWIIAIGMACFFGTALAVMALSWN
jgi:hypothetical protein